MADVTVLESTWQAPIKEPPKSQVEPVGLMFAKKLGVNTSFVTPEGGLQNYQGISTYEQAVTNLIDAVDKQKSVAKLPADAREQTVQYLSLARIISQGIRLQQEGKTSAATHFTLPDNFVEKVDIAKFTRAYALISSGLIIRDIRPDSPVNLRISRKEMAALPGGLTAPMLEMLRAQGFVSPPNNSNPDILVKQFTGEDLVRWIAHSYAGQARDPRRRQ